MVTKEKEIKQQFKTLYRDFIAHAGKMFKPHQRRALTHYLTGVEGEVQLGLDNHAKALRTALIQYREIGLGRQSQTATLLYLTAAL